MVVDRLAGRRKTHFLADMWQVPIILRGFLAQTRPVVIWLLLPSLCTFLPGSERDVSMGWRISAPPPRCSRVSMTGIGFLTRPLVLDAARVSLSTFQPFASFSGTHGPSFHGLLPLAFPPPPPGVSCSHYHCPGSWRRPISLPHRAPKLTLTAFGNARGNAIPAPAHADLTNWPVATSCCAGRCADSVTCPEDCSKLPGRSKPLPHPRPGCASLRCPIKTLPLCDADPAPDQPERASALTNANSIPVKHDIRMDPFRERYSSLVSGVAVSESMILRPSRIAFRASCSMA